MCGPASFFSEGHTPTIRTVHPDAADTDCHSFVDRPLSLLLLRIRNLNEHADSHATVKKLDSSVEEGEG